MIDAASAGPLVLVGSSMGGWLALLVALARRDRVTALVGVAAARLAGDDVQTLLVKDGDHRLSRPADLALLFGLLAPLLGERGA